jgi:cytochrome c-type biogenesis protein CcmH/NrfG
MKQLQALIRDNPTHYPRAWFVLGELAYEGGSLAEAADDFSNALHWDPGSNRPITTWPWCNWTCTRAGGV